MAEPITVDIRSVLVSQRIKQKKEKNVYICTVCEEIGGVFKKEKV